MTMNTDPGIPQPGSTDEIFRLLADPTRLGIYKAIIAAEGQAVTSSQMATRFGLHSNVARMHLQKLAEAGLLESEYQRREAGGRPARGYTLGSRVAEVNYPPRDYQLLAGVTVTALETGSDPETIAREKGRDMGARLMAGAGLSAASPRTKLLANLKGNLREAGLFPRFAEPSRGALEVNICNCVYKELSTRHADLICRIHQQIFVGVCETYFPGVKVTSLPEIASGGTSCCFSLRLPARRR